MIELTIKQYDIINHFKPIILYIYTVYMYVVKTLYKYSVIKIEYTTYNMNKCHM